MVRISRRPNVFFFPISFSLFFRIFAFKHYIFIIADILKMILWLYKLFTSLHMHIHLHYLFAKTVNCFKKSDRLSENPVPFIYYSDSRKETVWIYIGRTGFTLFRRFRRFRRAELPDEYSMQCTPPKYLLRHKCLRKDHFICCSSLEWHLWQPLILKVTSHSDEMPDTTVLQRPVP